MLASYDKQAVARRFSQCAKRYNQLADLQQTSARILLNIVADYLPKPSSQSMTELLDLGCGPGNQTIELEHLAEQYIGVDIAAGMLAEAAKVGSTKAKFVQADMDQLPFKAEQFDLVFSNLAVQWSNSPQQLLFALKRRLKPGGTLAFSTVLNDSLQPLGSLRQQLGQRSGINAQPNLNDWLGWADAAGFTCVYKEQRKITLWFDTVATLMRSISAIGADHQRGTPGTKLSVSEYANICRAYERYRAFDGLPLTYQIGYIVLKKQN